MVLNRIAENQVRTLSNNYKLTPATLAHKLNPRWVAAPHLLHISLIIAQEIARGNGRIIISVPPRHGKSELITKYTSVWCLEHFQHWNTILATYGAELSTDFGREVRDIIQANQEQLSVRIRKDAARTANWKTERGGGMAAVGIGGAITGRGANVLLIDDYIKEIKEALSATYKEYIWNWFKTVAFTRIEPGGTCVIIATRWATDDLIGRILQENPGGKWKYIRLPAIAEEGDVLGRPVGAPLFPERYDLDALMEIKDTLGTFFFNALYQQEPIDNEAGLTNASWLQIVDLLPDMQNCVQARIWDLAATAGGGDYTAGTHMIADNSKAAAYITNVIRRRLSPQSVEALVRQTAIADGPECTVYIEQEPGASGKQLVDYYANSVLPEFKVVPVPSNDGKVARAQPFLAAAEAGRIKLLKGAWNAEFIAEFAAFPGGPHDDQIDTASIGYTKLLGQKTYSATWGRRTGTSTLITPTGQPLVTNQPKAGIIFGRRN